jgi:hypothetical protein
MTAALTVLDGGWKQDEAQIEALAFMDEVALEAERIYELLARLEATPLIGQGQFHAMRLMRRATAARIEYAALMGGDGGTAA